MKTELLSKVLKEKGQRFTKERDSIFKSILSHKGHFEPETLYLKIKNKGIKASRASVYRTINLFYKCGLIEKVGKTEHGATYEMKVGRGHHDHMLCIYCGDTVEFYSEELERLQEEICMTKGFKGVSHSLEIRGYCKKCQKRLK